MQIISMFFELWKMFEILLIHFIYSALFFLLVSQLIIVHFMQFFIFILLKLYKNHVLLFFLLYFESFVDIFGEFISIFHEVGVSALSFIYVAILVIWCVGFYCSDFHQNSDLVTIWHKFLLLRSFDTNHLIGGAAMPHF